MTVKGKANAAYKLTGKITAKPVPKGEVKEKRE